MEEDDGVTWAQVVWTTHSTTKEEENYRMVGGGGWYCVAVGEGDMWLGLIWRSRNCGSSDVNRVSGERELINIIFCPSIGAHYIQISSDVVLKERTKNN